MNSLISSAMKIISSRFFTSLSAIAFVLISANAFSQPDLSLTINDLLNWQPLPSYQANVCTIPVHSRDRHLNHQIAASLDSNAKILYCPDGMDNFGPYIDSANKFNLFNFSHWQYIDILCWFGGSAGTPILIPSKSWVDAAHKNGVKVIGTVFMAPAAFGGSQAQVESFLQQDSAGNFIAAQKLVDIANFYNFDGWILNFETNVNAATGALASGFVAQFDSMYTGELIWYDAMLQNGNVVYQNRLNANNSYFFEHSTGLFTNYNWSQASTVTGSANYAIGLGRSAFDVYTGADMWPGRNAQTAFSDYTWIDRIISSGVASTSIAMFAMNFTFNYGPFSNFNNDSTDYRTFYATERIIYSGLDEDPFVTDATWKGLANYIYARTPVTDFPFETDFNTGHGLNYYSNGNIVSPNPWHNMSHQSYLPTWTFEKHNNLTVDYDFDNAFNGGSSLSIHSSSGGVTGIQLFSSSLSNSSGILSAELAVRSDSPGIDSIQLSLNRTSGGPVIASFMPVVNGGWQDLFSTITGVSASDTITEISLLFYSTDTFTVNIGRIGLDTVLLNSTAKIQSYDSQLRIYQNSADGIIHVVNENNFAGRLLIYDLKGAAVYDTTISGNASSIIPLNLNGIYFYEFNSEKKKLKGKFIFNRIN
jgi:endo-beta-N-acetylglucosaminidase D